MGPPPFGSGNLKSLTITTWLPGLQWGHRLSVVETWGGRLRWIDSSRLQWGHRLSVVETAVAYGNIASNYKLQWGHRLSVVETGSWWRGRSPPCRLQWGHRLSVVETALYGSLTSRMHRTELFSARNGYRIKGVAGVATLVCRVLVEKLREVQHDSFTIGPLAG